MRLQSTPRAIGLLRLPIPLHYAWGAFALVIGNALALSVVPVYVERASLAEVMLAASELRVDPVVDRAEHGRWPDAQLPVVLRDGPEVSRLQGRDMLVEGVELAYTRADGGVARLQLHFEESPGGILRWRCSVIGDALAGLPARPIAPAVCRP